jgi:putative redox protein
MSKTTNSVHVDWTEGFRFRVESVSGAQVVIDGDKETGLSPMETLLASLATCMGADVVSILQKMRTDLRGLTVGVIGERNPEPPRYYERIDLTFSVVGDVPLDKIEKAIDLSREKYCSVFHSLRQNLVVGHKVDVRSV